MVSYAVSDVKSFMNLLLRSALFDEWELREAKLFTLCRYTINGLANPAYREQNGTDPSPSSYLRWGELRPAVTGLVRGRRPPSLFQVVLAYPLSRIRDLSAEPIESLLMNVHFENGSLRLITATSLKTFSLDRTYEQYWDRLFADFCRQNSIELTSSDT